MDIKKIVLFFAIMVITAGCTFTPVDVTPTEDANLQPATPTPIGIYKFTIATADADSEWYSAGKGLSSAINDHISTVFANVKETDSLMENVDLLTSGKAGLVFVYDFHVVLANRGELMSAFPDAPTEKITIKCGTEMLRPMFPDYAELARIVLPLYEEQLYIVASEASGIASLIDLKGKHISTGEAGSATEQQTRFILTGLGMDWEKEISHEQIDLPTAIRALKNREIDGFVWSGHSPSAELSDLLSSSESKFKLIPISGDEADKIIQANPVIFHKSRIPVEMYRLDQKAINTLGTTVVLAAMEDFPAAYVSKILAAFFVPSSTAWKSRFPVTPEASINLLYPEFRSYLHQGAINYFIEQGSLK